MAFDTLARSPVNNRHKLTRIRNVIDGLRVQLTYYKRARVKLKPKNVNYNFMEALSASLLLTSMALTLRPDFVSAISSNDKLVQV